MYASNQAVPVADSRLETARYYKTSQIKVLTEPEEPDPEPPAWLGVSATRDT